MERYEALEILKLYEASDLVIWNGPRQQEIYTHRQDLVLKAQELLISDEEWELEKCGSDCDCCQKKAVPEDEPCSEGEPDEEFEEWLRAIVKAMAEISDDDRLKGYGVFYMGDVE